MASGQGEYRDPGSAQLLDERRHVHVRYVEVDDRQGEVVVGAVAQDPESLADRPALDGVETSTTLEHDTEDLTEQAVIVVDEYAPRLRPFPARPSREAAGPDVYPLF